MGGTKEKIPGILKKVDISIFRTKGISFVFETSPFIIRKRKSENEETKRTVPQKLRKNQKLQLLKQKE